MLHINHRRLVLRLQRIMHLHRCGLLQHSTDMHSRELLCRGRAWYAIVPYQMPRPKLLTNVVVARIEAEACERPQRSRQKDLLIPLAVEIPAWICPWLRAYSRWTTSNDLAVDDWLMVACGVSLSSTRLGSDGRLTSNNRLSTLLSSSSANMVSSPTKPREMYTNSP